MVLAFKDKEIEDLCCYYNITTRGMKFSSRNPRYQVAEFLMPRGLYIGVGIRVSFLILIWLLAHQVVHKISLEALSLDEF